MVLARIEGIAFAQAAMLAVCMSIGSDATYLGLMLFGVSMPLASIAVGVLASYVSIQYTGLRDGHLPRVCVFMILSTTMFGSMMALLEVLKWML